MPKKQTPKKIAVSVDDHPDLDPALDEPLETASEEVNPTPIADVVSPKTKSPQPTVVRSTPPAPARKFPRWAWWVIGGVAVVILALAAGWYLFWSPNPAPAKNSNTVVVPTSDLVRRVLDGVPVRPTLANPPIIATMIENIVESRPPSGLDKASVVYEALAEGGITRFLALYPNTADVTEIGPIRSARLYYVNWAEEYNPLYVHVGGSPEAMSYLRSGQPNVVNFDDFSHGPNFARDAKRFAPHNLYTSMFKLNLGLKDVAPSLSATFSTWLFKNDATVAQRPLTVPDITIDFSSFNYKVTYAYDRTTNTYARSIGGKPHVTRDGTAITVKNIVVQYTPVTLVPNDEKHRLDVQVTGTGKAIVFRDGVSVVGTWKKDSLTARTRWYDAQGQEISIDAGTTWIEIVPNDRTVTY